MNHGKNEVSGWIRARDALATLSVGGRNPVDVKEMLADYLRDGHLRAHVDAVWLSAETNLGKAWRDVPDEAERNLIVPGAYWRTDKNALVDRTRWRWPYDRFFYTVRLKPLTRRMFEGVSFSADDLTRLQPHLMTTSTKRVRGRNPDVQRRDAGWLAIVDIARSGNLNYDKYPTQERLVGDIKSMLQDGEGDLGLGETQIRDIVRTVHGTLQPRQD